MSKCVHTLIVQLIKAIFSLKDTFKFEYSMIKFIFKKSSNKKKSSKKKSSEKSDISKKKFC